MGLKIRFEISTESDKNLLLKEECHKIDFQLFDGKIGNFYFDG